MRSLRLVALTGGLLAVSGCGDSASPVGPPFFTVFVDGAPWVPDTASCLVLSNSAGFSAVAILASRLVSAQSGQDINIAFSGFPALEQVPLAGIRSPATAFFSVYQVTGGVHGLPLLYTSGSAQPGLLSITAVNVTDSLMTGAFSFAGATTPDSTPHHAVSGQFRLRYQVAHVP